VPPIPDAIVPPGTRLRIAGLELAILARAMRRMAPILLVAAALGLGACGGGNDNKSTSNASTSTTGTTTSSTTTTSTTSKTTKKKGSKSGGGKSSSGKGKGKSGSSGGKGKSGSSGGGSSSGGSSSGTPSTASPSAPGGPVTTFKTARTVCGTFLPDILARQIKSGKKSRQDVAKLYSKGWPKAQRADAERGCLAGLTKRH